MHALLIATSAGIAGLWPTMASAQPMAPVADAAQWPRRIGPPNSRLDARRPGPNDAAAVTSFSGLAAKGAAVRAWSRDGGLGSLKVEISAWALGLGIEGGLRYDRMSAGNTAVSLNYGLQVHPLFWLAPKFSRWFDPSLRAGALAGVNHESSHLGSHLGVYVGAGADIRLFALGSVPRRDYLTKVDRKNLGDLRTTLYLSGNYDRTWTSSSSSSSSNSELGALTLGLSLVKRW